MMEHSYQDLVKKCKGKYEIKDHGLSFNRVPRYKIINRKTCQISVGSVDYLYMIVEQEDKIRDEAKRDRLAEEVDKR